MAGIWQKRWSGARSRRRRSFMNMKTLPKTLLIASALAFALSLTGPGSDVWHGILKPAAALMFVTAFIVHLVSSLDPEQYAADSQLRESIIAEEKRAAEKTKVPERRGREAFAS